MNISLVGLPEVLRQIGNDQGKVDRSLSATRGLNFMAIVALFESWEAVDV